MNILKRVSMFARPSIDEVDRPRFDDGESSGAAASARSTYLDPSPAVNFDRAYANLQRNPSDQSRDQVATDGAKRVFHQFTSLTDPEDEHRTWDTDPIFDVEMSAVRREDYLRYRRWAELEIKAANDELQEYKFKLWNEQNETREWHDLAQYLISIHVPSLKRKDLTYEQMRQHARELRKSQIINEPIANPSLRRGEEFDPNGPIAIPMERMSPLWDNHQDRVIQHGVETSLISAALMQRVKNFRKMQLRVEKAEKAARKLGYAPLVARCAYYKGIALVGMDLGMDAREAFQEAELCTGRYEEGKWARTWATHTIGLSPARSSFSDEDDPPNKSEEARYADDNATPVAKQVA